jgi:hypothetical protein
MNHIYPRTIPRDGLFLCVECWGEYKPNQTSRLECGHSLCIRCDSDYTLPCPICHVVDADAF